MMNTTSTTRWSVAAKNIILQKDGVDNLMQDSDMSLEVVFNPALPYIYIT